MKRLHIYLFIIALVASTIGLWWMGPIPQDPLYHDFADQRSFFGIPNFWNVVSNIPFLLLGAVGIWWSIRDWRRRKGLVVQLIPAVLSFGILTAFGGSAYYHWTPNSLTLVWDRLPMTLMFMPVFAILIYDFIGEKQGNITFWLLVMLGIFSVFYWHYTEAAGRGDLRVYAFVQYFPMLAAILLVLITPQKPVYARYLLIAVGWYVLAKLCEHFDDAIFAKLVFWSGHTIKHLLSCVSLWYVLKIVEKWRLSAPVLHQ